MSQCEKSELISAKLSTYKPEAKSFDCETEFLLVLVCDFANATPADSSFFPLLLEKDEGNKLHCYNFLQHKVHQIKICIRKFRL